MQRLVEDMLTLSRLESAEFQVRSEMTICRRCLHIVQEAQALSAGKHQFTLEFGPNCRVVAMKFVALSVIRYQCGPLYARRRIDQRRLESRCAGPCCRCKTPNRH